MACTFQATIGRTFASLIGLKDEDMDINTMITTYNTAVTDAASDTPEGTSQEKALGHRRCSQPLMKGEIWKRSGMKQKEQKIQGSKQEDSEGSEKSNRLNRCSVQGD